MHDPATFPIGPANLVSRRSFLGTAAATSVAGALGLRAQTGPRILENDWQKNFPSPPQVYERLEQDLMFERVLPDTDTFGHTEMVTSPTDDYVPNYGMGYQVYALSETGEPRIDGLSSAEAIERLVRLPFADQVYLRTDWREIQRRPGRLDLPESWQLAVDLARRLGKRLSFRIQLGNTVGYPRCAIPDFVLERSGGAIDVIPGRLKLPHYEHPEFQAAFRELNRLLASEYDKDPAVECVDLMGYGAWGEWHAYDRGAWLSSFPDSLTAVRTLVGMVDEQLDAWVRTPLVMGAHRGSASFRLKDVIAHALRAGCWLRRDNVGRAIHAGEAFMLTNRPPWIGAVIEDGVDRSHAIGDPAKFVDECGQHLRDNLMMRALDLNGHYWALWQHADNVLAYRQQFKRGFEMLDRHLGYRVRPAYIWVGETKPMDLIIAIRNDGAAPPPGILRVHVSDAEGKLRIGGGLDPGTPGPFQMRQCRIVLPVDIDWKTLRLSAELEIKGVRHPVRWACREKLNPDGSLTLRRTNGIRS